MSLSLLELCWQIPTRKNNGKVNKSKICSEKKQKTDKYNINGIKNYERKIENNENEMKDWQWIIKYGIIFQDPDTTGRKGEAAKEEEEVEEEKEVYYIYLCLSFQDGSCVTGFVIQPSKIFSL